MKRDWRDDMYACLYAPRGDLAALAFTFSPVVEKISTDTVVFSIDGLGRLIGTTHQIAAEISRCGAAQGICGNLALAHNPDTAVLVARNTAGVTVIPAGKEAHVLAGLPICALTTDLAFLETFESWGIRTLAELAALPELGLAARFGEQGAQWRRLALGRTNRTLRVMDAPITFAKRVELDCAVNLLEPLLFVLSSVLRELTEEMRHQAAAANRVELILELGNKSEYRRILELATACGEPQTLLKLLQLDLEAHPPSREIVALRLNLQPVSPQALQHGLFLPASPEPQKLQLVTARLAGLVGEGNVGTPELLNTHRPNGFEMRAFHPKLTSMPAAPAVSQKTGMARLHLAFRIFRPAPKAEVRLKQEHPVEVRAQGICGAVRKASGPWHSSGDWWTKTRWSREEWDIDLSDGGMYRIYLRQDSRCWFVEGFYD